MSYNFEATEDSYIITIPKKGKLPEDLEGLFNYFRYLAIGEMSQITETDVQELVELSRGAWFRKNKEWLKDVPGYEWID